MGPIYELKIVNGEYLIMQNNEIEYLTLESKKIANLEKIDVGESTSIFTKLKIHHNISNS